MARRSTIDELNLFVNPVAIGKGMRVFTGRRPDSRAAGARAQRFCSLRRRRVTAIRLAWLGSVRRSAVSFTV